MKARSFLNNQDCSKDGCRSFVAPGSAASRSNCRDSQKPQAKKRQKIASSEPTRTELDCNLLRQMARARAQQGDYAHAIEILNSLIESRPSDANDYNNRGLIYFQSGQLVNAIADYNKAIQLNPDLAAAYNNRANYYADRGQLMEAIADYDKALDLNPVHVRAWINQGITFRDLKLYERAIDNFDFALRLGQLKSYIWAERGRTYHLMGDWNYAVSDYRRALEELPVGRRRQQVETWLADLLSPLQP
ncbi:MULTISPECIES: tetratricopeptide repeat protein [Aerosakkonema]|uniref:tetratricopeptide repeat protein n=1 Tax=Aerosakkonema TaxID=1246629 RepID=UPI0035B8C9EC